MITEAQALDLAALCRGISITFHLKKTMNLRETERGVIVYFNIHGWDRIISLPLRDLAKVRKKGGRDLIADVGEEYGLHARLRVEERAQRRRQL